MKELEQDHSYQVSNQNDNVMGNGITYIGHKWDRHKSHIGFPAGAKNKAFPWKVMVTACLCFLLLIMLQLMRREHKHRHRGFNWGIAKTVSAWTGFKMFSSSDVIFLFRPGQKSGWQQAGLQNRDSQHLHQTRRSFARGSPICLPRSQWGRGPCVQVSLGSYKVK